MGLTAPRRDRLDMGGLDLLDEGSENRQPTGPARRCRDDADELEPKCLAKYGNASWNVTSLRFATGIVSIFAFISVSTASSWAPYEATIASKVALPSGRAPSLAADGGQVVPLTRVGSSQK